MTAGSEESVATVLNRVKISILEFVANRLQIDQSLLEAEKYGFLLGQLSKGLRKHVETMWIHKGEEGYGGGNKIASYSNKCGLAAAI